MKKYSGLVLLLLMLLVFQTNAVASEPLKIGVLDMQRCIQESNAGKKMTEKLKAKQAGMQKTLDEKKNELIEMQNNLQKQGLMLSENAKEEKQKEYDKKKRDLGYLAQDLSDELKQAQTDAQLNMLKILESVVTTVAKNKKLDMVIERNTGGVLYSKKSLDITDAVIAALNKLKQ